MLEELSRQHLAGMTGARDQDALRGPAPGREGLLRAQARPQLRHAHREEDESRSGGRDGERDVSRSEEDVDADEEYRDEPDGGGEAHCVAHAGILPGGAVDAEEVVANEVGKDDPVY